mmetsp:Transcript_9071/g.19640  ORF Transcript_9071/g.19640 Transcript_9071/m.19640 type:complete len:159 (+) Transcript_9071:1-477(+)
METNIGQDVIDAQNALGQAIVDAQNTNGQAIVDARNAISDQHNQMFKWLRTNVCAIYESSAIGGVCAPFIGPLEEGQMNIPLELYWPEGQLTLVERLEGKINAVEGKIDAKIDAKMNAAEGKIDGVERKVAAVEAMMMHLVEQNMKLMHLMEHKAVGE